MEHSAWLKSLLENLDQFGEEGRAAAAFIRSRRTRVSLKKTKPHIGAWWTVAGNINLNSYYYSYEKSLNNTRVFTLIIHEVRHLQQGFLTALSVYGELEAWQLEWSIYHKVHGKYPHPAIAELMSLPLSWERSALQRAVQLMQSYASRNYRADLLPYYPIGKELSYRLFRKLP